MKIIKKFLSLRDYLRLPADICIDLGTANTVVSIKGKGIVLNEPSVVAIKNDFEEKNKILAVGEEAKQMVGRTPASIKAIYPMKDGVIADYEITEAMIKYFIKKANKSLFLTSRVFICVPYGATPVDKKAIHDAAVAAGARKVILVEEPLAAAIGANLQVSLANGVMVVDIGGGTTEIGVLSLGSIASAKSFTVAGYKMDEAIKNHVSKVFNIKIGDATAEKIKKEIGCAIDRKKEIAIKGFDTFTGSPKEVIIKSLDIMEALNPLLTAISDAIRGMFDTKEVDYDLCGDIATNGVVLTGGGALIYGIDKFLEEKTGLVFKIAKDPLLCVINGLEKISMSYK